MNGHSTVLVCALVVACSSSNESGRTGIGDGTPDDGSGGSSPGPAADDFCRTFVNAFAAYLETCSCGTEAVQPYRDQAEPLCDAGFLGGTTSAVAAEDLIFDSDAAAALLARLDEPNPLCVEELFRDLKLQAGELYSFAGTFKGTRELGSPCTLPVSYKGGISDCREGACASDGIGGGVCIALVGEGEPCDESGDHNLVSTTARLCFDDARPPDSDGEYESAFDSLSCNPTASGAATGTCVRDLANGGPCGSRSACQSGRCIGSDVPNEGVCAAKLPDGEVCMGHLDCQSGACGNGNPRVCGPKLENGQPCDYDDAACASGSCNDLDVSGGVCSPAPTRALGESCSSSFDCVSAGHGGSRDAVCHSGICVADICANLLP
jgi:hypothetical protein